MRSLLLMLVGAIIVTLLGLSGIGTATGAEEEAKWLAFDPQYPTLKKELEEHREDIAKSDALQAVAERRLSELRATGGWFWTRIYWTLYRRRLPETWRYEVQVAERRLNSLQAKHKSLVDKEKKVFNKMVAIETDGEREAAALKRMANLTELERWGIDARKQAWLDKDVWFMTTCHVSFAKGPNKGKLHSSSPKGAHGLPDLLEKIESHPNRCLPNEEYTTKLEIESWVFDSDGKRQDLARVTRDGADYKKA